ncbi:hypothetical protein HMPREF9075_00888 [Capnocytophaga sp. oral taxon 332 str. F0381]|nr:hypothetical protein HMPREF9075_00888 [Capnocytophaga sp. oral taxon 332 str. F0381]
MRAAQASHTQLRQLADFPSLILRSTFGEVHNQISYSKESINFLNKG